MNFSSYVKEKKIQARKNNIEEVRKDIDKAWVKEKIQNHMDAFDGLFTYDEIRQEILTNDLVASKFCKDPSKQNISEILAAQVLGWEKKPSQGSKCIRFNDNGDIVTASTGNTKSADFQELGYYITQKYTEGEGGHQDNQRNDVIDFLKRGSIKHKVMAVVDGEYWDDKYRAILIEEFKDNPNVKITSVTELTENNLQL